MDAKNDNNDHQPAGGNGQARVPRDTQATSATVAEVPVQPLPKVACSAEEVGRMLGVPASTVANLHRTGALRAVKIGGRLAWRPRDVQAYVEALEADG